MNRQDEIDAFLAKAGWDGARRTPLAGDSSARRYERLHLDRSSAVLMDALRNDPSDETGRFIRVGQWLRSHGFSAPDILAFDAAAGLLLLEDLGDDVFAQILTSDETVENRLYSCTTDFLVELQTKEPPGFVPHLDTAGLVNLLDLTETWFLPAVGSTARDGLASVKAEFVHLYDELNTVPPVLSLRDFHAENLIWLPDRIGTARCGLLDFQDAVATHPAYDVVSLLQDARRNVSPSIETAMVSRFVTETRIDHARFTAVYALLGAQRALRILGIFARLARSLGKPRYLDFVPRVWSNLQRNLQHPLLVPMAAAFRDVVPELGEKQLASMRSTWVIPAR